MTRKIGAHVSASGGLEKGIERAHAIGANCAQIFSGSPRVWKRTELAKFNVEKMFSKRKELNVEPVFTHSLYLINLASDKPDLLRKSFDVLQYDLQFDSLIKGSGIVVHLGSHTGRGWEDVREQVAEQIAKLLQSTPSDSTFLIENSAGQNGKLCSDLSEIRWLIDQVGEHLGSASERLGWCLDTCHAHAAGYALGTEQKRSEGSSQTTLIESALTKTYTPKQLVAQEIENLKLWESLRCIHVNDSKDAFASGRDRHENIGQGNIPKEDLRTFLNHFEVKDIPIITEAPGYDGNGPDAPNIDYLKNLCK